MSMTSSLGANSTVFLSANVQSSPPAIRLNWENIAGVTRSAIKIARKLPGSSLFPTSGANVWAPAATANTWTDTSIQVGQLYEYQVTITHSAGTAYGHIASGIEVPARDMNGIVLLVVDSSLESAIASQLNTLENDLVGYGWIVKRKSVARNDSISSVQAQIKAEYDANPTLVRAAFIVGHAPVPSVNGLNPDGHGSVNHWSADSFYADLNGAWSVSGNSLNTQNIPSAVELQVGRITTAGMSAFPGSEAEQMINYLNRLHSYKTKAFNPQKKGLLIDGFGGYNFSANGYRVISTSLSAKNLIVAAPMANAAGRNCPAAPHPALSSQSYRWTYLTGGGGGDSMSGVACTDQMSGVNLQSPFNLAFGSYFGAWNGGNAFLRAPLLSGGLTISWAGTINYPLHHMAMGGTIGYSTQLAMNNKRSGMYLPLRASYTADGYDAYVGMLGDPTLVENILYPPGALVISRSGANARFSWTASSEPGIAGYHVYKISGNSITKIATTIASDLAWTSNLPYVVGEKYMVRAYKLETTSSGSYWNQSLGSLATAQ